MEDKREDGFKVLKGIWYVFEKFIFAAIIVISLIIIVQRVSNNSSAFLGLRIFRVQTGSMVPKYKVGDVILIKERIPDEIKIGDDITYISTYGVTKGKLITHQVIGIEEEKGQKVFRTKGLANPTEDPTVVYGGQINGTVLCKIRSLTLICTLLNNTYVFYFGAIVPLTFIVFFVFLRKSIKRI